MQIQKSTQNIKKLDHLMGLNLDDVNTLKKIIDYESTNFQW